MRGYVIPSDEEYRVIEYFETIGDRRVLSDVQPGYLKKLLPTGPPEEGEKWSEIQRDIESKIMPGMTHWQSPDFMAYFPSCTTYPSMLGELYSAALTAPAFNWLCSPAVTELETVVLDWLAHMMNLPACFLSEGQGGGVIQGTASEAIVTVMVAARERAVDAACQGLEGEEREEQMAKARGRLIALGTEESHSSTAKAAKIAGVRYRAIPVQMNDDLALTGAGLQAILDECRQKGLEPFYLTTTLGTTGTCATDRFEEIKEVKKYHPLLWIHVDAAYAGAALICEEYQHLTASFDAFDSFDVNLHKWLLVNFDASCLFVKCRLHLTSALSIISPIFRNQFSSSGLVTDYRDWQIPLGRRFRSLKVWFVLRTYGVAGLKSHIRKGIKLGETFHSLVRSRHDLFRVLTPPAFALTVLTVKSTDDLYRPHVDEVLIPGMSVGLIKGGRKEQDQENEITREVYEKINAGGQIHLSSTVVKGAYAIRVVSANELADEKHIQKAFEVLVVIAEKAQEERRE
ncbi:hypothetical protein MMC22_002881 [Lobaria immixta]|nr:hypothetical protein [Lobaria immixta]